MNKTIIVTGGCGFIGSALIRYLLQISDYKVVNIDKLTYAGSVLNVEPVSDSDRYLFEQGDITNPTKVNELFEHYQPAGIMHLAAESHVDRSIDGPAAFIQTNINGTYNLLEAAREYQKKLSGPERAKFRFLHVSTDEVYGQLGDTGYFTEKTPYDPHSPYSASKASSDHLARAWFHTFDLPVLVTNCSNNYGPYQFPEKLIPVVILKALSGQEIPVYGKGENVRDWLYVEDHVHALLTVFENGTPGETYNIGGNNERQNIEVVQKLTSLLDELKPAENGKKYAELISFVTDRPGHDWRYAIDAGKIKNELGWEPSENFESGMRKTVEWYLNNINWCEAVTDKNYGLERLGNVEG